MKQKNTLIWLAIILVAAIFILPHLTSSTTYSISEWFVGILTGLGLYGWVSGNTGMIWLAVGIIVVFILITSRR